MYKAFSVAKSGGIPKTTPYQRYIFHRVLNNLQNFERKNVVAKKISESGSKFSPENKQKSEWLFSTKKGFLNVVYEPPNLHKKNFNDNFYIPESALEENSHLNYDYVVEEADGSKFCYKYGSTSYEGF